MYLLKAKKEKRSAIFGVLFTYLLISKVLYYYGIIVNALFPGDFRDMVQIVLARLLTQDIVIILVIILSLHTDKLVRLQILKYSKTVNQAIVHIIDYLLYIGVLFMYFWVINFAFGFFAPNMIRLDIFIYFSVLYLVIVAAVEIKKYFKKKEQTEYATVLSTDEKLVMLKTLLDNSVLTQEEYYHKEKELLGM